METLITLTQLTCLIVAIHLAQNQVKGFIDSIVALTQKPKGGV